MLRTGTSRSAVKAIDEAIAEKERELVALRGARETLTRVRKNRVVADRLIRSRSSGLNYRVVLFANSLDNSCTCPDFTHRSIGRPGYTCKHIREAMSDQARLGLNW